MPLKDIQRRGQQLGRARMGVKVVRADGTSYPKKLSTFRFTTNSRAAADQVAQLYGGEVKDWANGTERFEVITEKAEIDVMVPPGEAFVSQWYEMWTAAGCTRRCDGETASLFGDGGEEVKPCICPSDPKVRAEQAKARIPLACKPHTRLSFMLPDVVDLGVWRLDSTGFNAAVELGGKAELLQKARDAGHVLPAVLRLEQRETRTPGEKPKVYMVPVLEIGVTLRQLTTGAAMTMAQSLPPAPDRLALPAGTNGSAANPPAAENPAAPTHSPVAGATGPTPAQAVADQAAAATSADVVVELGRASFELLEHDIVAGNDTGPLGKYLAHRVKVLQDAAARAAGDDDGIVDADVVEDSPTVDDAREAAAAWAGE